ncbi:MAG: selenium cofactor biosynthesis protein YqeC [Oscillospiraceae bacterium]|nr:selenium cofactor biosynthesis protein YqeC [Oscillospiraceae bacterium]
MIYTERMGLRPGDVATVVGSGGKTSLLARLVRENRHQRVLVSTTTKMLQTELEQMAGAHLLYGEEVDGKITAPPIRELATATTEFDLILLECDGSRGLPLKGWAEHEPVVPTFATVTVSILPIWPLGQPVGPQLIHREAAFCALTGAALGKPVTIQHLAAVIRHPNGLFQNAHGRNVLCLNVRTQAEHEQAAILADLLQPHPYTIVIGDILA